MAADSVGLTEMPQYEVVNTEEIDWVQQVQFKPIEVAKGLWIVPKWSTPPDPKALNVMLDPGLAFGTGEHPTTRLCVQWLQHAILFLYNQNCAATGQASLMPWSLQESQSVLEFGNLDKEKGIALKPGHCRHFLLWHQLVVEA
ncbi:unnamed protein product [Sphagnum jensenii]|uniref:ETFB lysine methyltransferase n=1 Tax=Sphagnum jensenii TaxID=128206 RepID=A0ABP0ZYN2_9BRYO